MNIKKIDHIGIVVAEIDKSKEKFGKGLGLKYLREEISLEFNCRIAFFLCGDVMIELIEPTGPSPSQDFLRSHGEGLHHICYEVDDIEQALTEAKTSFETDYLLPKVGAGNSSVFFLNPTSICHVETEFVQLAKENTSE